MTMIFAKHGMQGAPDAHRVRKQRGGRRRGAQEFLTHELNNPATPDELADPVSSPAEGVQQQYLIGLGAQQEETLADARPDDGRQDRKNPGDHVDHAKRGRQTRGYRQVSRSAVRET